MCLPHQVGHPLLLELMSPSSIIMSRVGARMMPTALLMLEDQFDLQIRAGCSWRAFFTGGSLSKILLLSLSLLFNKVIFCLMKIFKNF